MASPTPEQVSARLRAMRDLSARAPSPMPRGVDMSPGAVGARLRELAELARLCAQLGAGRIA